ncbi:MAG: NusG domain II-containing protein [Nitrospirota bacterium]|nr:NusG domain II-containing protein [Nitrospirota bacterium]
MKKALRNTTIADRTLFLLLIIASVAGFVYTREAFPLGSDVVVEVNGKPVYTLSLGVDTEIPIEGTHGLTVLEIKDGKVRMKEADCSNQICVNQGWMSKGTIVCLPNHIVVIVGSGTKKDLDAITG